VRVPSAARRVRADAEKKEPSPSQSCGLGPSLSRDAGEGLIPVVGELRVLY